MTGNINPSSLILKDLIPGIWKSALVNTPASKKRASLSNSVGSQPLGPMLIFIACLQSCLCLHVAESGNIHTKLDEVVEVQALSSRSAQDQAACLVTQHRNPPTLQGPNVPYRKDVYLLIAACRGAHKAGVGIASECWSLQGIMLYGVSRLCCRKSRLNGSLKKHAQTLSPYQAMTNFWDVRSGVA